LNRIAQDKDVSAGYKEQLIDPLLGMKDNSMFNLQVFELCETLAADLAVTPEAKEKLLSPLLAKAGDLQATEPDKAEIALHAVAKIVGDGHISAVTKETAVSPALAIAGDESLEDSVRLQAVQILYNAAVDNRVSASSKVSIVHGIGILTPRNNALEEEFDVLIQGAMAAALYDKDVDPVKKEKALQIFTPLLSSEDMSQADLVYTLQNIGSVIQDAEVGASVKEQVVQPLEKLITDNLASMQKQASWFEVLVAGLGDLTVIMNDPQMPQATRDGIKTWISGLNIFSTETKQIWDEYNTVVVSEKNAFLNANTIAAIKNVLASQPEIFRPGIIKLQDSGDGKNGGYYDFSTTLIKINAANDIKTVPHYEKNLLHEMGHYITLGGKVDAELLTSFDPLWDSTDSYLDCSDPYGYLFQEEDIAGIFEDYVSDTEDLVGRAVLLADNPVIQNDTLLLKVAGIAQFYSHAAPSGEGNYTYIFSIDSRTGGITRYEVPLTNHEINKAKYLLPTNATIVKIDSFPTAATP